MTAVGRLGDVEFCVGCQCLHQNVTLPSSRGRRPRIGDHEYPHASTLPAQRRPVSMVKRQPVSAVVRLAIVTDAPASAVPHAIRAAQLIVALQSLALGATAAGLAVELAVAVAHRVWIAVSLAALAALASLVLFWCSRALAQQRLPARTPVVMVQLLCLPVGYGLVQAGRTVVGAPIILAALGVLACLASGQARHWFD